jgi:acyl-CoA synthetase (AMP-forming)/AMP-acid ligase II
MDKLGCELQQRYGCTEAGGQITFLSPADHVAITESHAYLAESCGRETPQADVRVLDDDGNPVAVGEIGEVVIRCDSMARGYWNRPEQTAEVFRPEGVRSGDLGRLDEDGYLYLAGRKNDMIVSGGFNVYPAELERVLGSDPGVDLVAVVGAPHPEWGETPVAVVVATADVDVVALEARLRDLCRTELATYKQPRMYEFRTDLPLSAAGKILKREIEVGPVGV